MGRFGVVLLALLLLFTLAPPADGERWTAATWHQHAHV